MEHFMPSKKSTDNSTAPKKAASEDLLSEVLSDFDASWEYAAGSWHQRWNDNYYLYNNNRVKRGYQGISDTFVPMVFSTVETLTSGLFGAKPKFDFLPPKDKQDQKTDILNSLLDFYWDKDQWSLKIINTGRNMFNLGTAIDYFCWEGDHPVLINVPIRDFFIDPTATSLENARFMGRRYLTTLDELESFEIVDLDGKPDSDGDYPMKKKYTNLNKINEDGGSTGDNTDKQEKDMWYGSTVTNPEDKQIEVIEYWTDEKTISIANRTVVIEDCENYYLSKAKANGDKYAKGIMPFADARDYIDESLFYAKGETDFIGDLQEMLNDITNQNIDAVTFTLNPMFRIDPKYAHLMPDIESLPGAGVPAEAGAFEWLPFANIPKDAFNERINIKNEIRETTASNEVVKGVGSVGAKTTATEINAQVAGAGQRINLKVTQIENGYFHRLSRIVFRMVQLYVTEPMMVRILGKDGARWEEFDPSEFDGEYEPRVQLDVTIENQKQEDAAIAKEMLAAFLNDPDINQQELKKMVLSKSFKLDPDEVEALMQQVPPPVDPAALDPMAGMPPMPDPMMQGMPQDPMMGAMPPMAPQMPMQDPNQPQIDLTQVDPEVLQEALAMVGAQ